MVADELAATAAAGFGVAIGDGVLHFLEVGWQVGLALEERLVEDLCNFGESFRAANVLNAKGGVLLQQPGELTTFCAAKNRSSKFCLSLLS